jgi:ABC-type Zn uptake system ZnuABC Zn-binding protein ZnuA
MIGSLMPAKATRLILSLLAVVGALALTACGESKEDKALAAACSAKDDIGKQVDTLKSITPETFTAETVQTSLNAIHEYVKTIGDQLPTLKDDVKSQVQSANDEFKSQLSTIAVNLGKSISLGEGKEQVKSAASELAGAYQQAFASLDCSDAS